ncbi:hypothetical protein SPI_01482 [Niveomyces insectorum RCEF 264]|uniref:Uncharacterized protein n=1 Tax=Niveomyces insectorum RCEF 264 TaxID=1081102 RepID=A0A167Z010_9HYPO|nr:hypothetical protein SPI_01482 [Niveomyces insectorum RCEF 264]
MASPENGSVGAASSAAPRAPHRHQISLENVIHFSTSQPLQPAEHTRVRRTFYRIVEHFEAIDPFCDTPRAQVGSTYSQPLLIRYTFEYALSDESRGIFLRAFFYALDLDLATESDVQLPFQELAPLFSGFAEHLIDHFFSPVYGGSAAIQAFIGTEDRLSLLWEEFLVRDRHRCVISRVFGDTEFIARFTQHGNEARDDDGVRFTQDDQFEPLKDVPRKAVLAILNMFDKDVVFLIDSADIDLPCTALTLTTSLHNYFGAFQIFFDAVPEQANTYRIQSFLPPYINHRHGFPITRSLFVIENRAIDPPSPRLLAAHRAIAHILHLSGAGYYINRLLRDIEDKAMRLDGFSDLGRMGRSQAGWLDGWCCSFISKVESESKSESESEGEGSWNENKDDKGICFYE